MTKQLDGAKGFAVFKHFWGIPCRLVEMLEFGESLISLFCFLEERNISVAVISMETADNVMNIARNTLSQQIKLKYSKKKRGG